MPQTVFKETGAYESLIKTIGAWLKREWANYSPTDPLVADINFKFVEDTTHNWKSKMGTELVVINLGDDINDKSRKDSSNQKIGKTNQVFIDVFMRNSVRAEAAANKINNIIAATYPNQVRNILKSDATSISKITRFQEEEGIKFIPVRIMDSLNQSTVQMAGILTCEWELNNS